MSEKSEGQITHPQLVAALVKPGAAIIESLTPDKANALHMAVGISGEAGELLDAIKKLVVYNKPMTPELFKNIVEELGDLEFYMEGIRQQFAITRQETLSANIEKLRVRYSKLTYTDTDAQQRVDKAA